MLVCPFIEKSKEVVCCLLCVSAYSHTVLHVRAFVLTPGLTWSVHGDLYGSVVSGHLWWVGEYCDCQREALACGDIKQHQMTYHLWRQWPAFIAKPIPKSQVWLWSHNSQYKLGEIDFKRINGRQHWLFERVYLGSLAGPKWKIDWRSQYLVIQTLSPSNSVWVGERHFNSHFLSQ